MRLVNEGTKSKVALVLVEWEHLLHVAHVLVKHVAVVMGVTAGDVLVHDVIGLIRVSLEECKVAKSTEEK